MGTVTYLTPSLRPDTQPDTLDAVEVRCYAAGAPHTGYLATLGSLIDANREALSADQVLSLYALRIAGNTDAVSIKVGLCETLVERADARRP